MNRLTRNTQFLIMLALAAGMYACSQSGPSVEWISTTDTDRWIEHESPTSQEPSGTTPILIDVNNTDQTIDGFGACFNELGWEALNKVPEAEKMAVLQDLFNPETGSRYNIMRMPLGANDYSVDWYSFNETPGDYAMENFTIARDRQRLIPYIKEALQINPGIKVWASPWGPPSWMKTNNYYAGRVPQPQGERPRAARPAAAPRPSTEGMTEAQIDSLRAVFANRQQPNTETNLFIMDDQTLTAYGLYFSKFLEEYKKEGIDIYAVHVQNEPNSAQNFPSCTWTPEALNTLVKYVGKQLETDHPDVEVWLGTIERGLESSVDPILSDPEAAKYITGVGFQWAGKGVVGYVHETYPQFKLMQTESECGNGSNDWPAMEYTFSLMKLYLSNGVETYLYWNPILGTGESSWGWVQNSLITVTDDMQVRYNPEFYLMKHFSSFIEPGARFIDLATEENCLAFLNPDNEVIIIYYNDLDEPVAKSFAIGNETVTVELQPKSLNTLAVGL